MSNSLNILEPSEDRLLDTREAARRLGVAEDTLRFWRVRGHRDGPPFIRVGSRLKSRVRYSLRDLQQWIESHKVTAP